jgi:hypothetical protein
MAILCTEEGTNPKESNLRYHHAIKQDMFENADSATRAEHAAKA